MLNNAKEKVMEGIRKFVSSSDFNELSKKKKHVGEQIKNLKATDFTFGAEKEARFVRGYIEGNVRSVGSKTVGDIKYDQTLNFDFNIASIGFVREGSTANDAELQVAALIMGMRMYNLGKGKYGSLDRLGTEIFKPNEYDLALQRNLYPICKREHAKLGYDYYGQDIKVLESKFYDEDYAEVQIYPIYFDLKNKSGKITRTLLGYYTEYRVGDGSKDGLFIVNADDLITDPKTVKTKKILKRVLIVVGIIAAVIIVQLIIGQACDAWVSCVGQ